MSACPDCRGRLSTPILGRRTGLWLSTCRECGFTRRQQELPSHAVMAEANHSGMFITQSTPTLRPDECSNVAQFDRVKVGAELRRAILKRRELEKLNAADGKLKQGADQVLTYTYNSDRIPT